MPYIVAGFDATDFDLAGFDTGYEEARVADAIVQASADDVVVQVQADDVVVQVSA